ncbi:sugar phosphate isomerase/epimerase family protein [Aquiflexum gelatinilyticum]|uniref:Sugar phosphate isomerase/epimerase n=1 Tax=Aquiflexum gelatinilyticum TaxID=2961943 RepID=A0A9X2PBS4_9BACT|nr:sugar phosphate isomerase/epimerase [Aquiflexum gelatinilyticum]MCR9017157.1 sugar phosphate isomerase/epimerase [Aquiflexum gelatinilyticum]MCS4434933.1 sugar phosphate isomerase/epimerase [Aquiflexum gelatinilyticum]
MTTRRTALKTLGLTTGLFATAGILEANQKKKKESQFSFCLNTSTIMGQKPGLIGYLDIAAKSGYDGVELWIRDIQEYISAGNSAAGLKKYISDSGLKFENAIGFAPWMVDDEEKRKAGMIQMEQEMELLASLGCTRVAAPAAGVSAPLDLFKAGGRYKALLDLGRKTGVMPQLEFWGAFPFFHHLGQVLMVAAVANDPDTRILPDVYHLFRGGSGYDGLKMLNGSAIEIFHMNDFVASIPREDQADKDRVYPGDGAAPMKEILRDLKNMGGNKVLSLELFNQDYWKQDALTVAKTGLEKMKKLVNEI